MCDLRQRYFYITFVTVFCHNGHQKLHLRRLTLCKRSTAKQFYWYLHFLLGCNLANQITKYVIFVAFVEKHIFYN